MEKTLRRQGREDSKSCEKSTELPAAVCLFYKAQQEAKPHSSVPTLMRPTARPKTTKSGEE